MGIDKLSLDLPPHERVTALEFRDESLRVFFTDSSDKGITADAIVSLRGARISNADVAPTVPLNVNSPPAWAVPADAVATNPGADEGPKGPGEFSYVVVVRVAGVAELWFLMAESFNFRRTLCPDAGYSTETNLRALVKKLAAFAPKAKQDTFFMAVVSGKPLPPPVGSLAEFFKTA